MSVSDDAVFGGDGPTVDDSGLAVVSHDLLVAGTTFYEGVAAAHRGLVGGGNQVFLPWADDAWVVRSGGF